MFFYNEPLLSPKNQPFCSMDVQMESLDPVFPEPGSPGPNAEGEGQTPPGEAPLKILLADVPPPRTPVPLPPPPGREIRPPTPPPVEVEPSRPSRLAPIKSLVKTGYFDPAKAFEYDVDWPRFWRAQGFLLLLSLCMPFLVLLLLGVVLGITYMTGASLYSATAPNPVHEVMLYPVVFILARGYWIAYLLLPLGLYAICWLWAALTAGLLAMGKDSDLSFGQALGVLAMLGAMLAPFTLFPFIRLLALAGFLWLLVRRMEDTFEVGFWRLVGRGGLILVGAVFLYGAFERKVESYFPAGEELRANLEGFVRQKKHLDWPSFHAKVYINPNERLFADLSDFTPQVREQAIQKALAMLKAGTETPDFRFRLAQRLAEDGQIEACLPLSRCYSAGVGTAVNLPLALDWMQKAVTAQPANLELGLEKARLLFLASRRLEGKQWLVQMAKGQMKDLGKVTAFVQKENLGQIDSTFTWDVQGLYQQGNTSSYSGTTTTVSTTYGTRYVSEYQTRQEVLTKKLYVNENDKSLWFYRALVAEYARSEVAGPEVYGEASTDFQTAELQQKIKEGDPVALDTLADRSAASGDVATARRYWIAATQVLNNDSRRNNVPYYLKLAESYAAEDAAKAPDPREATKYYLATLLISSSSVRMTPIGMDPLQRLLKGRVPDPAGQPFLDLCLKHDIPEAWVMMGDRYFNGDFPGVPKNVVKAKDCFLKAQALGYKGPQFFKQLALLDPPRAAEWNAQAGGK